MRVWVARQSGLCLAAIDGAASRYHLSAATLGAIARVETGRPMPLTGDRQPWPWTVNAGGASHFFVGEPQAVAWTRAFLAHSRVPVDVGCMQVDLHYHPDAFRSLDQAFDPVANADYAASLLVRLAGRAGDMHRAAGLYHSGNAALADPYRAHVGTMRTDQRDTLAAPVTADAQGRARLAPNAAWAR